METDELQSEISKLRMLVKDEEAKMDKYKVRNYLHLFLFIIYVCVATVIFGLKEQYSSKG